MKIMRYAWYRNEPLPKFCIQTFSPAKRLLEFNEPIHPNHKLIIRCEINNRAMISVNVIDKVQKESDKSHEKNQEKKHNMKKYSGKTL